MKERRNKLLLFGAISLLFPLCTYLGVFFIKFREDFALIRLFLLFASYGERNGPALHTYWNAAGYLISIVIAMVLLFHDFGKRANRAISVVGIVVSTVHLASLLRMGLLVQSKGKWLTGLGMLAISIASHGFLIGIIGYILLLVGFRKFLCKPKLKPWEVEVA